MAIRRYLHVSKQYSEYATLNPAKALAEIHQRLYSEYEALTTKTVQIGGVTYNAAGSTGAALELQNFFQALKQTNMQQTLDDDLLAAVDQTVINDVLNAALRGKTKHFFQTAIYEKGSGKRQGFAFERQLSQIVAVVRELAGGGSAERSSVLSAAKTMNIGTRGKVNTNLFGLTNLPQQMAQDITKEVYANINNLFKLHKQQSPLTLRQVEGKVDVSGATCSWTISSSASPYLQRIATLLSQANFTAKSYRSLSKSFKDGVRQVVEKEFDKLTFKAGDTNMNRVLMDVFNLHYPPPVSLALLMALNKGKYLQQDKIQAELAQIRFVYELTGKGQQYLDNIIQDAMIQNGIDPSANYLIFNDPSTNEIYVRATADVIIDLWKEMSSVFASKLYLNRARIFGTGGRTI